MENETMFTVTQITGGGLEEVLYKALGGFKCGWRMWRRVGVSKVPLWHPAVQLAVHMYEQDQDLIDRCFVERMRSIEREGAQFVTVPAWAIREKIDEAVAMLRDRVGEGEKNSPTVLHKL